jgi:hypothetical protein
MRKSDFQFNLMVSESLTAMEIAKNARSLARSFVILPLEIHNLIISVSRQGLCSSRALLASHMWLKLLYFYAMTTKG